MCYRAQPGLLSDLQPWQISQKSVIFNKSAKARMRRQQKATGEREGKHRAVQRSDTREEQAPG